MEHKINDMIFIHYGNKKFDIEHFFDITNNGNTKPQFGLWGCPVSPFYFTLVNVPVVKSGLWVWVHNPCLCLASLAIHKYDFLDRGYFKFTLKGNAKILIIKHSQEIRQYCIMSDFRKILIDFGYPLKEDYRIERDWTTRIDFDRIKKDYDGMFVYHDGNILQDTIFRNWETDSIVIWNPEVIKIVS